MSRTDRKGRKMKLTDDQIGRIENQYEVSPIPESEPIIGELSEVFGEHTFYLGESGLVVWDRVEEEENAQDRLVAVQLAAWSDETRSAMRVHEPVSTGIVASMSPDGNDADDQT